MRQFSGGSRQDGQQDGSLCAFVRKCVTRRQINEQITHNTMQSAAATARGRRSLAKNGVHFNGKPRYRLRENFYESRNPRKTALESLVLGVQHCRRRRRPRIMYVRPSGQMPPRGECHAAIAAATPLFCPRQFVRSFLTLPAGIPSLPSLRFLIPSRSFSPQICTKQGAKSTLHLHFP